jgi:hypothetical protein
MSDELDQPNGRISVPREYVNEELAHRFHDTHERLAESFHLESRKASAVPWDEVPAENRALMVATVSEAMGPVLDSIADLRRQRDRLREALVEAREDVADWATYADVYFQEKHGLAADLARIDAALAPGETKG